MIRRALALTLLLVTSCALPESPGALVPPTVSTDPTLPWASITVAGQPRRVHVRTFGDPEAPPVLVLHGSLADGRGLLGLSALADRHYVVVWDQRGNGLSERITAQEYTADSIVEEIDAMANRYAPGRRFSLVGHSFGGMYAALYAGRRPERVERLALLEPGGLSSRVFAETYADVIRIDLLDPGLNAMFWQNAVLTPRDHEQLDLRALMVLLNGHQTRYFCDADHPPHMPVWRPGGHVDLLRGRLLQGSAPAGGFDFDFTAGLDAFTRPVLFLAGACSALGPEFQRRYHLPLFRDARLVEIPDAGHRFPVEAPERTIAALRAFFDAP